MFAAELGGDDSGCRQHEPGAGVATATMREQRPLPPYGRRHWPQPAIGAESPALSVESRRKQKCCGSPFFRPFCSVHGRQGHHEKSVGQEGQGDVAMPALPAPHLVFIKPHFAFSAFEGIIDGPAHSRHAHQILKAGLCWRETHIVGQFRGVAETAPHQQPVTPTGL